MKLPEKILASINYYHYTTNYSDYNITDCITIYFKPWWKRSKAFNFRRIVHSDIYDNTTYTRSAECVELIEQLRCTLYGEC